MEKKPRGTHEVVVDVNSDLAVVRWKDNKVVTVASTYCGAATIGKAKRFFLIFLVSHLMRSKENILQ